MPYCTWCRSFIERLQPKWRCDECGSFFCDKCVAQELLEDCPFCVKKDLKRTLRRVVPTYY